MALPTRDQLQLHDQEPAYHVIVVETAEQRFLRTLGDALGCDTLRVFTEAQTFEDTFDRSQCGGLVTALAVSRGRTIAVVWSDFRVNAASYGHATSRRFVAFLRELRRQPESIPLLYFVNTAGVSLMEGRAAFSDAFLIVPELMAYAEQHLVLTCASGRCLGLGAILFGLGHYRVAVGGATQLNLTGPEVIRLFFGEGVAFDREAAAERSEARTDLVHELVPSKEAAVALFLDLIAPLPAALPAEPAPGTERTARLLAAFLDGRPRELVPGWCPRVRLFLGTCGGRRIGVFVNPPERSNNMIAARTLEKYGAGLDVFRALGVPVISLLDAPGIDPRFEQTDANVLRKICAVAAKIIAYPHGTMGVVTGRCFGGATTLAFPKVFGGRRALALRGSRIGTMHESIVSRVLGGSARLLEQWRAIAATQSPECEDLVAEGTVDAMIEPADLRREVDRFLAPPAWPRLRVVP